MPRLLAVLLALAWAASAPAAIKTEKLVEGGGTGPAAGGAAAVAVEVVSEQAMVRISTLAPVRAALAPMGFAAVSEFPTLGWTLMSLPGGMSVKDGLAFLRAYPGVLEAAPNHVLGPSRQPSDAFIGSQAALSQIDAQGAWDFEVGATNKTTIVIVDTGIEGTHPDLQAKIVNAGAVTSQYCESTGAAACVATPVPTPACNHATQVAGIAGAVSDNAAGIAGVSWGAQLLSVKVFDDGACNPAGGCPGACTTSDAAITRAIVYATGIQGDPNAGKVVVNLSLGCTPGAPGCGAVCNGALQVAINNAVAAGIPISISAGNDGGAVNNPAICVVAGGGVMPVGAVSTLDTLESFSSRGAELAAHGVVAPGRSVFTTSVGGTYTGGATGTSFSSPHVAGVAALVLSAKPAFTAAQVETSIRAGADSLQLASTLQGAGRLNAFKALRFAVRGSLAGFDGQQKPIAFPNPFRVSTSGAASFSLPPTLQGSSPKISIFTLDGQSVRELSGLVWDGKNAQGTPVASGTYVFVVKTSAGTGSGRLAVLR